jgi:hypothetical protein
VLFVASGSGEGVGVGCCGAGFGWTGVGDFGIFGVLGAGAFGPGDFGRGVDEFVAGGADAFGSGLVAFAPGGSIGTGSFGDGFCPFVELAAGGAGISFGCGTDGSGDFGEELEEPVLLGFPPLGCFGAGCFGAAGLGAGTGDFGSPLEGLVDGGVGDFGEPFGFGEAAGKLVEFETGGGGAAAGVDGAVAPVWLLNAAAMYSMLSFINGSFLSL